MAKTNKLSKIFVVLLFVVVAVALTFAFVNVPTGAANAEDPPLVLEGNTAQYTFEDVSAAEVSSHYLNYKQEPNEWVSQTNWTFLVKLKLTVTAVTGDDTGAIAFRWKISKFVSDKYEGGKLTVQKTSDGSTTDIVTTLASAVEPNAYNDVTIPELKVGDEVLIQFEKENQVTFTIAGLNRPGKDLNIIAQVEEGQQEFGTIVSDVEEEQMEGNQIVAKRSWGESVTFTAQPSEGYSAYWVKQGDEGDYSRGFCFGLDSVTVNSLNGSNNKNVYICRFVKDDGIPTGIANIQAEGKSYWNNENGVYTFKDIEKLESSEYNSMFFAVKNAKFFKFDFEFGAVDTNTQTYTTAPVVYLYLDGQRVSSPISIIQLAKTYKIGEDSVVEQCYVPLPDENFHVIEIIVYNTGSSSRDDAGQSHPLSMDKGNIIKVSELELLNAIEGKREITFRYNPHLSTLTIDGEPVQMDDKNEMVDHTIQVSYLQKIDYKFSARSEKFTSAIDKESEVSAEEYKIESNLNSTTSTSASGSVTMWRSKTVFVKTQDYALNNGADTCIFSYYCREKYDKAPKVTVNRTDGDTSTTNEQVEDNQTLKFTFGKENSLTIFLESFGVLTADNFVITINGKDYPSNQLQPFEDKLAFIDTNISRSTVVVQYKDDDRFKFAEKTFTLKTIEESENAKVDDIIKSEQIKIVNDQKYPWVFSAEYSENENYAFRPGNSEFKGETSYNAASIIEIDVEGSEKGVLTLEFKLQGTIYSLPMGNWFDTNCAQLFYKFGSTFDADIKNASSTSGGIYSKAGVTRFAWANSNDGTLYGTDTTSVKQLSNGWYRLKLNITEEQRKLYIAFVEGAPMGSGTAIDDQYAVIRNVNFVAGSSQVEVSLQGIGSFDASDNGENSYKGKNEKVVFSDLSIGDTLSLKANVPEGDNKFYGWIVNDEFYSADEILQLDIMQANVTVIAVIQTNNFYEARIKGKFYEKFLGEDGALESAQSGDAIVLVNDVTINQAITIEKDISLVIPYGADGEYYATGTDESSGIEAQERISWATTALEKKFKYLTVTIDGVAVNVQGKLIVGGVLYYPDQSAQGHTSGAYSHLVNNGTITIEQDGVMDVYGRVTGTGSIMVNDGAKLYEPFLILDFAGGTNTFNIFMENITPFRRYAMINIECPMTINCGGKLIGHAGLYASKSLITLDQPFISDETGDGLGSETMIMLKSGTSVTITYNKDKVVGKANASNNTELIGQTSLEFTGNGGAIFSYMLFSALGFSIPTTSVYFSIPYNFDVKLGGTEALYETRTDFMIMPGATVEVCEKATLHLHANAYVYDGLVQGALAGKSYPTADDLKNGGYSKSGNLIVNGKLIIDKKITTKKFEIGFGSAPEEFTPEEVPATFLGIIQTNGTTGMIEIEPGTILKGTIVDGLKDKANEGYYFEYTATARVWDAVHGCFAQLEAGKTYTATSGDAFTLDKLNYASTNGGEQTSVLQLDQSMHGSWKLADHDENSQHVLDWTPKAEDGYDKLGKGNTHVTIHRQCNVLGCSHKEDRELLFKVDSLGNVVYTGSEITEDEFKQLFKLMFGVEGLEEHAEFAFDPKTNVGEYDLTITLDSNFAYWYNGNAEAYAESYLLKYHIVKKGVTVEILDQHVTYNGAEQSAGSVANKDWQLKEGSSIAPKEDLSVLGVKLEARGTDANSYDITLSANTSNYNVKFEYKGSVAESVAKNAFVIDKANIKIKANDLESAQDDALLDIKTAGYSFLDDTQFFSAEDKQLFDSNLAYACEGLSNATVAEYDIVITIQDGFTMQNYNLETPANGTYYVRDSIFKDVKVTLDGNESLTVTFDGRYHKLAVTGLAPEIQAAATISYKYQGADMPTEGFRNANEYPVEISIKVAGHSNEYTATHTLKIEAAPITIKILPQSKVYDGKNAVLAQDKWEKTDGNWVDGTTPEEIIALKFAGSASVKNFGKYDIVVECSDSNYKVNFTDGTEAYSIEKAPLTVTAHDQRSTYGENPVTVGSNGTYTIDGWLEEAALDVNVSHTVTNTTPWKEGGYEITVSVPAQTNPALGNYDLHEVNGTYTVDKRDVKVTIKDQNDVFEFGKTYSFDLNAWELDASTPLANGEQSSVLHIALARPTFDGAGKYAITATYNNSNYNVTFEGSWATEDENEGKAGTYTIDKKTLTDDSVNVIFMLIIGDEDESHEDKLSVIFNGDPIALDALVYVTENGAPKSLAFTISPAQLTEVKEYAVTVTIDDKNYAGSRTFTVEVLTAEGYSQTLRDALNDLAEAVGDLTADALTSSEEHFGIVKQVKAILDRLSEEDKQTGAAQLEKYDRFVEKWHEAASISDDVIDTAKTIADSPIKWLFAMAEMSILLAAMYVIGKGGLMQ